MYVAISLCSSTLLVQLVASLSVWLVLDRVCRHSWRSPETSNPKWIQNWYVKSCNLIQKRPWVTLVQTACLYNHRLLDLCDSPLLSCSVCRRATRHRGAVMESRSQSPKKRPASSVAPSSENWGLPHWLPAGWTTKKNGLCLLSALLYPSLFHFPHLLPPWGNPSKTLVFHPVPLLTSCNGITFPKEQF